MKSREVSEKEEDVQSDQIFAMKRLVEEYLGKDKKLYAAFMDLKKAYHKVDREAPWSVLKTWCRWTAIKGEHPGRMWVAISP